MTTKTSTDRAAESLDRWLFAGGVFDVPAPRPGKRIGMIREEAEKLYSPFPRSGPRDDRTAIMELRMRGYAAAPLDLFRILPNPRGKFPIDEIDRLANLLEAEQRYTPEAGHAACLGLTYAEYVAGLPEGDASFICRGDD
ncbi:hypothetical protein V7x_24820 [Crateriforma conspicua]|uniref:Uncharacterized protein n=1 Tax=Crateriforma conspicua TaxID=2527996 RepID=A0A5C6G031_9PLAN|nr:hypothetical protein [Crateriforma conspicua]TWU66910.1 hypothetical protein V7x_24820 [Crateriforma conspicua]